LDIAGSTIHQFNWIVERFPLHTNEDTDIPLEVYTALKNVPKDLSFAVRWGLKVYSPLIKANRNLLPEILAFVYEYMG